MMMDCERIRSAILESLDEPNALSQEEIEHHIRGCPSCAAFASRHHELDARLTTSLTPPSLGPAFHEGLQRQIRRDIIDERLEQLPDILHVIGCGIATLIYVMLTSADASVSIVRGVIGALFTYAMISVARTWLESGDIS